jgi:hypothetical protein
MLSHSLLCFQHYSAADAKKEVAKKGGQNDQNSQENPEAKKQRERGGKGMCFSPKPKHFRPTAPNPSQILHSIFGCHFLPDENFFKENSNRYKEINGKEKRLGEMERIRKIEN